MIEHHHSSGEIVGETSKETEEITSSPFTFRVASLNCWGLLTAPKRKARFISIARFLTSSSNHFDFITLQEVWVKKDFERLKVMVAETHPYTVYFPCGVIGSGLAILSRLPISQTFFKRFTLNGSPDRILHGDFYSGKGVGGVRINICKGVSLDLYTTHFHSEYNFKRPSYTAHRLAQSQELVQFVENTSRRSHIAIVTGDLNTTPDDFPFTMMISSGCANRIDAPLVDAWITCSLGNSTGEEMVNLEHQNSNVISLDDPPVVVMEKGRGDENGGSLNTSNPNQGLDPITSGCTFNLPTSSYYKKGKPSQRLDYILYAPRPGVKCKNFMIQTEDALNEAGKISFSDHAMLWVDFEVNVEILTTNNNTSTGSSDGWEFTPTPVTTIQRDMVLRAIGIFKDKRSHVKSWQKFYMAVALLMIIIFIGITIATAITIPNDQLTPILILALFGVQPAVLVTAFSAIFLSRLFLQEERSALSHFINEWEIWLLYHELTSPNQNVLAITNVQD